jgi:hypothetical protein
LVVVVELAVADEAREDVGRGVDHAAVAEARAGLGVQLLDALATRRPAKVGGNVAVAGTELRHEAIGEVEQEDLEHRPRRLLTPGIVERLERDLATQVPAEVDVEIELLDRVPVGKGEALECGRAELRQLQRAQRRRDERGVGRRHGLGTLRNAASAGKPNEPRRNLTPRAFRSPGAVSPPIARSYGHSAGARDTCRLSQPRERQGMAPDERGVSPCGSYFFL